MWTSYSLFQLVEQLFSVFQYIQCNIIIYKVCGSIAVCCVFPAASLHSAPVWTDFFVNSPNTFIFFFLCLQKTKRHHVSFQNDVIVYLHIKSGNEIQSQVFTQDAKCQMWVDGVGAVHLWSDFPECTKEKFPQIPDGNLLSYDLNLMSTKADYYF